MGIIFSRPLFLLSAFVVPSFFTYCALEKDNIPNVKSWSKYWASVGLLFPVVSFFEPISQAVIPFYGLFLLSGTTYLLLKTGNGRVADGVYHRLVAPFYRPWIQGEVREPQENGEGERQSLE